MAQKNLCFTCENPCKSCLIAGTVNTYFFVLNVLGYFCPFCCVFVYSGVCFLVSSPCYLASLCFFVLCSVLCLQGLFVEKVIWYNSVSQ